MSLSASQPGGGGRASNAPHLCHLHVTESAHLDSSALTGKHAGAVRWSPSVRSEEAATNSRSRRTSRMCRVGVRPPFGPGRFPLLLAAALSGVPAGRLADRFGAIPMIFVGLIAIALGCAALSGLPATLGIAGYLAPMIALTVGYALFMTANNTAVMTYVTADQRGVISGLLNLSRNLGLITGAAVMGAVFATASASTNVMTTQAPAVVTGMQTTFAIAAMLMIVALVIAYFSLQSQRKLLEPRAFP